MQTSNCLIITGMHRSGTSVVAQSFFRAGLFLGDKLGPPSAFNPDGYFEDEDIRRFHDEMLATNQASWHAYRILRDLRVPSDYKSKGAELINIKFGSRSELGWKDPRTTLFLNFWKQILPEAKWIFVFRKPAEVVWSLLRRGDTKAYSGNAILETLIALRLWTHYNNQILTFASKNLGHILLIFVPQDFEENMQKLVNEVITDRWSFKLGTVDLINTYNARFMSERPPLWVTCLTNVYLPAHFVFLRLKRLHNHLLDQHLGKQGIFPLIKKQERDLRDKKHVVCIVSPNKFAYSETFIRAHIERIPAKVKVLYGGWFPTHNEGDRPLISLFQRCIHLAFQKIFDVNPKRFQIAALRRYLRRERVEVVLAEYGPTGVSVMEACRSEGIPLIVHFHGFDASAEVTLERYSKDYKYMFGLSSAIIVVSRDMKSKLLALGAPGEKLHYNPCGVDCDLFLPGDPSSNPPVFVSIGRFAEKKAPHLTLLAFHKVHQQHPDAQLVMIGDGPLLDACKLLTHALHLSSVVEFLGVRSHSDVAAIMRTARAFVQHSVRAPSGDSEGTPVAVLEGGAAGLPVVATRHGGIRDIVIEEETGLLVDEGDIEGMADQMLRLAKDADLAARLGRAARKRVFTEFSMEKSIGQLWEIMIRAIDKE